MFFTFHPKLQFTGKRTLRAAQTFLFGSPEENNYLEGNLL